MSQLFQSKPLRFDATVLVAIAPHRFLPSAANNFQPGSVRSVFFDDQFLDLGGTITTQRHGFHGLFSDQGLTTHFSEFLDLGIVHMTPKQNF